MNVTQPPRLPMAFTTLESALRTAREDFGPRELKLIESGRSVQAFRFWLLRPGAKVNTWERVLATGTGSAVASALAPAVPLAGPPTEQRYQQGSEGLASARGD